MLNRIPAIGLAAYSGTGKTTLAVAVLEWLRARGLRVAVIKHVHHNFDIDQPGKDSYRLRQAGASPVLVASSKRWVLMNETPGQSEPALEELLTHLDHSALDMVLVEGFKHSAFPKIELHRVGVENPYLFLHDPHIIALATDTPIATTLPQLDINTPACVAEFIYAWLMHAVNPDK
jgi:molybdopterin-guanine dinucleotide biosynthesis adapter protein